MIISFLLQIIGIGDINMFYFPNAEQFKNTKSVDIRFKDPAQKLLTIFGSVQSIITDPDTYQVTITTDANVVVLDADNVLFVSFNKA